MIYVTGDTHADFIRFTRYEMHSNNRKFNEKDYVIVCGDFGLCWDKSNRFDYYCNFFKNQKFTTLWIQGNHENYDMIAEYPLEQWKGGLVRHIVRDKVILLERGQVYEIEGKTFFTFGGAASHDIQGGVLDRTDIDFEAKRRLAHMRGLPYRINHESWWAQELPSEEEMQEGRRNLERVGYKVDYVLTHCCSTGIQNLLNVSQSGEYLPNVLTDYLQEIEKKLDFKCWFFGHYHDDLIIDEKHILLYYSFIPIEN